MRFVLLFLFFCLFFSANAQLSIHRGMLQRKVLYNKVLKPQLDKSPLKLTDEKKIAEFFAFIEKVWAEEAPDSLKKYPSSFSAAEYIKLDAYSYLWALTSVQQQIDAGYTHADLLITQYMAHAMLADLNTLERLRNQEAILQIDAGSLGNTLSIGTMPEVSETTFLASAEVFKKATQVFTSLLESADSLVRKAAASQLKNLEVSSYPVMAGNAFYGGHTDKAMQLIVQGLSAHRYSPTRAMGLSKKLMPALLQKAGKPACLELLEALATNITPENLQKEDLLQLYLQIDPANGRELYHTATNIRKEPTFAANGQTIALPEKWNFLNNAPTQEQLKKAKYILVDFWFTNCGPCLREIPELNEFAMALKDREDILFISVNTDYLNGEKKVDFVRKRSNDLNIRFPVVYDDAILKFSRRLGVDSYPTKFILDVKGNLITKTDRSSLSLASFYLFLKENKSL